MNNHPQPQQHFQQNMQMGSGLTRYRSAPSSYFASFLDTSISGVGFGADDFERLFNPRASSPETLRIFSRFMNSGDNIQQSCSSQSNSQFLPPTKIEPAEIQRQQNNGYSSKAASQMTHHQSHNNSDATETSSADKRVLGSFDSNRVTQTKMQRVGGANNFGLIRHSSSPAGLFANLNIDEFGTMRGMGDSGGGNIANAEASFSSTSRFKTTCSGMMGEIIVAADEEDRGNNVGCITGFHMNSSWDDDFFKGFSNTNATDDLKNEGGNQPKTLLSHHLSLPKSSAAMEKLLQDSVPCKIRAKRGCATHPRSIAERVRRTKISERMRKLQELVPNMEKQTNTSDMLDLAVEYIKDLQRQLNTLSDNRAKCSCEEKQGS